MKWRRESKPFFRAQTQSWYVEIDGRQINLGVDETTAAIAYHQAMVDHYSADPNSATVQRLVIEFLADIASDLKPTTCKWYKGWLESLPDCDIATLDEKAVKVWLRSLPGGSHTQRAGVRAVKRFVKWCAEQDHPVQNLSKIKAPAYQPRDRYLTDTEWATIQKHAKPHVLNILRFMYLTGCRPEEARTIEPRHFDAVNSCFTLLVEESKGEKKRRTIYLTEEALALTLPLMDEGPIFKLNGNPWTKYSLSKQVRMLARDAKVSFSAYTMRHTFVSRAIRKGVNIELLRRLVGHRDLQMISTVYAHVDAGELRQAAAQAVA